jgi:hypothetical protein
MSLERELAPQRTVLSPRVQDIADVDARESEQWGDDQRHHLEHDDFPPQSLATW